jgi:hypothetical protein
MHELVGLGHSTTNAVVGLCRDETRTSEHIGISPAEEGWAIANDNEVYLVAALTCNVLQHPLLPKPCQHPPLCRRSTDRRECNAQQCMPC